MRMPYVQATAAPLACSLFAASPGAKAAELQPPTPLYTVSLPGYAADPASSANDVTAGQAGISHVGGLRADLLAVPGIDAASAAALGDADMVYMELPGKALTWG